MQAATQFATDTRPLTLEVIERSASVRANYGLLVNDSLTVALMELHGTTALATGDRDFLQVQGLQIYLPTDI